MRKDGHTKIMEYSLVPKQEQYHKLTGKVRPNVLKFSAGSTLSRRSSSIQPSATNKRQRIDPSSETGQYFSDVNSDDGASAWAQSTQAARSNLGDAASDSDVDEVVQDKQAAGSRAETESAESSNDDDDDDNNAGHDTQQGKAAKPSKQTERMMLAQEARAHLNQLFINEPELCGLLYGSRFPALQSHRQQAPASADMFFLEVVPVPPSRFRPAAIMGGMTLESPQNQLLTQILNQTIKLRDLNSDLATTSKRIKVEKDLDSSEVEALQTTRAKLYRQVLEACVGMQVVVNSLMDSTKNPANMGPGKLPPQGIKQLLEKKDGLFRMNMMVCHHLSRFSFSPPRSSEYSSFVVLVAQGKRVNYAARSVISPDINIETNEIGVPPVFAKKLTFPEFVTAHNYEQMHRLVCNGPNKHPGAVYVQDEDGTMISLDKMDEEGRRAIANTLLHSNGDAENANSMARPDMGLPSTRTRMRSKRVHRHLDDGDILILNRQPTLHKPSMMCHRARILKGEKTIRMHYANCNSYNADFDGDGLFIRAQKILAQSIC
jgi:DNA-directed RNA polymerase I subunit RPA1